MLSLITLIPLAKAFELLEVESLFINRFTSNLVINYYVFIISIVFLFFQRTIITKSFTLPLIVLLIISLNFLLSPLFNLKTGLNWVGFLIIHLSLYNHVVNNKYIHTVEFYERYISIFSHASFAFSAIIFITLLINFEQALNFSYNFMLYHYLAIFSSNIGFYKQHFLIFASLALLTSFFFWSNYGIREKIILLFFVTSTFFILIGMRTLHLSFLIFFSLYIFFYVGRVFKIVIILSFILASFFIIFFVDLPYFIQTYFDRSAMYILSILVLIDYPMGIGLGGYANYIENMGSQITSNPIISEYLAFSVFPTSPESDVVFLITSFGYFGVLISLFLFYAAIKSCYYSTKSSIPNIQKLFLSMFSIIIFSGISEDFISNSYWIIFFSIGLASLSHQSRLRS